MVRIHHECYRLDGEWHNWPQEGSMSTKKNPPNSPPDGAPPGPGREGGTETLERVRTAKPPMFKVLMHNDDYTTQEFVVHVLTEFFRKDPTEAMHLMLKVHTTGKAIAGVYTRDEAETKVALVTDYAQESGHPLMLTSEPDS